MILNNKPQGGDMHSTQSRFLNLTVRRRTVLLAFIASLPLALTMPAAYAGQYVLEKGKGVEVCEVYGRNLNAFSYLPYPMACERKLDPQFTDFSKPKWDEMDVWENRLLLRETDSFLGLKHAYADAEKNPTEWERLLKDRIRARHAVFFLASIDIDNDGQDDKVLRYLNGDCTGTHFYGTPLLVLRPDKSALDIEKTSPLLQNPDRGSSKSEAGRWGYTMYDVFSYKGQSYFDLWSELADQKGFLRVFQTRNNQTQELCSYRYKTSK